MANRDIKKIVLAYSGGLDTSIILKWLQTTYGCEVVTFTADLGQGEELGPAREKALMLGIKPGNIFIEDLREEFVRDYVFPMFRANALYEGQYLLGTSIARPLIAKKQIEIASASAPMPCVMALREKATTRCASSSPITRSTPRSRSWRRGGSGRSRGATSCWSSRAQTRFRSPRTRRARRRSRSTRTCCTPRPRARCWRTRREKPPNIVYQRTISPMDAPDKVDHGARGLRQGRCGERRRQADVAREPAQGAQRHGPRNGIGRLDLVENRFVGMKSRGVYETPGGTILLAAHRAIESITLDRGAAHLKDELMPRYAELIYNGFWFSPERAMLQALIDKSQEHVEGEVTLEALQGQRDGDRARERQVAVFVDAGHVRGRQGRLRPEGRARDSSG